MCGPSAVSVDSYGVIYATELAIVIICIMTVIALVASAVGIDSDALADFKDRYFRSDLVDCAHELVAEGHRSVIFTREGSLRNTLLSK